MPSTHIITRVQDVPCDHTTLVLIVFPKKKERDIELES